MARATGESRNALADRLLNEAIKTQTHPLIRFEPGALGRRRALVVGTRLYVYQVISTLRGNNGDSDQTAEDFGLAPRLVQAALAYYADFTEEVDQDAAVAARLEREERERWERQQLAHVVGQPLQCVVVDVEVDDVAVEVTPGVQLAHTDVREVDRRFPVGDVQQCPSIPLVAGQRVAFRQVVGRQDSPRWVGGNRS